ncbi:MAG: AraC family transcriptional regulator [Firmicutes bacterium]|jgi:AraC-like DNA-binding protein|nr:AraC family transcriptional regulator [Bacillota bacterium]
MQNYNIEIDQNQRELKKHGDSFFPIAAYDEYFSQFPLKEVPWHWHEELELIVVLEGSCRLEYFGASLILDTNDGVFINCNTLHRLTQISDSDCHIINFVLKEDFLGGRLDSRIYNDYIKPICTNTCLYAIKFSSKIPCESEITSKIRIAFDAFIKSDICYELEVKSNLLDAWRTMCKNKPQLLNIDNYSPTENKVRLDKIISFIHKNYGNKITIPQLGKIASISESECYRLFNKTLNLTPNEYLLNHRLSVATIDLAETNKSILEISLDSGFGSSSYFSKKFKEVYALTPNAFRKKYHKSKK